MRVISGTARGVKLNTIKSNATRPTTDRVKESLFSMIQFDVHGSSVLDAFAGSGALGIEALSRGAERCDFVDSSKDSTKIIKQNLVSARINPMRYSINLSNLEFFLKKMSTNSRKYDIIFLDPPYGRGMIDKAITWLVKYGKLSDDAIIIIEHDGRDVLLPENVAMTLEKEKKYGQTLIHIYRRLNENGNISG